MSRKISLVLTDGGMGDLVCELVAVDYLIKQHPDITFQLWCPDYLHKFAIHVLPPKTYVRPFSAAPKQFNKAQEGRTTEWFEHGHSPMRTHPVDYGFHMLADKHMYDLSQKNYLQIRPQQINIDKFELPEKYICLVTTAAEPVKMLSNKVLNEITEHILATGYIPVFLGKEKAECGFKDFAVEAKVSAIDYSKGINLVNKTNMLEVAKVISSSAAIVGMDSGLIHVAGCTDANIVAGYSLASPEHLAPIRQNTDWWNYIAVEPDENIPNRYYQTENSFYTSDYRTFPGWQAVLANLTAEKFIEALDLMLKPADKMVGENK